MEPLYPNYNLGINPFLDDSPDYKMIDRKEIMKKMANTLNMFVAQKSPKMYTILGNYGVGKTYALLRLKEKIEHESFLKIEKFSFLYGSFLIFLSIFVFYLYFVVYYTPPMIHCSTGYFLEDFIKPVADIILFVILVFTFVSGVIAFSFFKKELLDCK